MAKKRLRKGEGRVQFIACRDRVNELTEAGYGPVMIFEILTKEKRISMSYGGFYEAYRYGKIRKERRRGTASKNAHTPSAPTSIGREIPQQTPGVQLKELEEAMKLAAEKRGDTPKQSNITHSAYSRKQVIG